MVSSTKQMPVRSKSMKVSCEDLSYQIMSVETCGKAISKEQKEKLREKYGYCILCKGAPVLCFNVSKSRINPLRSFKEPLTVEGECFEGHCLKCHPEKDPRRQRFAMTKTSTSSARKKEMQRDLSNGSLALSQSRRDLFRSSRHLRKDPPLVKETSNGSLNSGAISSRQRSENPSNHSTTSGPPASPNPAAEMNRAKSDRCCASNLDGAEKAPNDIQRSQSCPMESQLQETKLTTSVSFSMTSPKQGSSSSFGSISSHVTTESETESDNNNVDLPAPIPLQASKSLFVANATKRVANLSSLRSNSDRAAGVQQNNETDRVAKLLEELASSDATVTAAAMAELRGLSTEPSSRQSFCLVMDPSKKICEAMQRNLSMASLQRDGAAILSNISVDVEKQDVSTVSRELLKAIVDALCEHKTEDKLVKVACFALRNLTCEQSKNIQTLREIEGVFDLLQDTRILTFPDAVEVLERLQEEAEWTCATCTYLNEPLHLSCAVCGEAKKAAQCV